MSTTNELIAALDRERVTLLGVLKQVPDEILTRKNVMGTWSIKDMLAHLTDQDLLITQMLPERLATGITPEIIATLNADVDAWNAKFIASRERLTFTEQLEELKRARQALIQVIRDAGEETMKRHQPWPEWKGTTAAYLLQEVGDHEHEHLETLLAALEKI